MGDQNEGVKPTKEDLIPLLLRPWEPLVVPKRTSKGKVAFALPENFIESRFRHWELKRGEIIRLVQVLPISESDQNKIESLARKLGRYDQLSSFNLRHQRIAADLIYVFLDQKSVEDLVNVAAYARERVNPYLFNYALSSTILHREDTARLDTPAFISVFPEKFIEGTVLEAARHEGIYVRDVDRQAIPIPLDYSATDMDPEHRLAYFREDLGVNSHHWHWHLVYPFHGPFALKDRRGELFYYMHRQLVARYNVERFCNKLPRVVRFTNFREKISDAYYAKINNAKYPGRAAKQKLQNMNRDSTELDIEDLELWRDRLLDAISSGKIRKKTGEIVALDSIDTLGNMVEASPEKSPNFEYYGNLHNEGHNFISVIHDPDHRNLENPGVMTASETAMRDPIFYRWHAFIDYIFQRYNGTLVPYKATELSFDGIVIHGFTVSTKSEGSENKLSTFWQQSDVDVSGGLDFTDQGDVRVKFIHLAHKEFTYRFTYENTGPDRKGTCRIFLSPKRNEARQKWTFKQQRLFMIELDRFPIQLYRGAHTIERQSKDSSVTIPIERIFNSVYSSKSDASVTDFCRCGWPDYLLLPKGTTEGFQCELFAMFSNDVIIPDPSSPCAKDAFSYCGSKDGKKFPDPRTMGFPFDRESDGSTLKDFMNPQGQKPYTNMSVIDVTIYHSDKVEMDPVASYH